MIPPSPVTRRSLLKGGLALGVTGLATAGCAYIPNETPVKVSLPKSAKAEIDGDLIYFNWADYLDPSTFKGFQREYGVKIIQSNFDSMEGMYAKIQAGNQYDIIFPIAKWVQKLRARARSAPSTTTSSPTPTRSSTPAPTTTTPGTTTSRPSRCRSPSTRPASAGAPTRSTR